MSLIMRDDTNNVYYPVPTHLYIPSFFSLGGFFISSFSISKFFDTELIPNQLSALPRASEFLSWVLMYAASE